MVYAPGGKDGGALGADMIPFDPQAPSTSPNSISRAIQTGSVPVKTIAKDYAVDQQGIDQVLFLTTALTDGTLLPVTITIPSAAQNKGRQIVIRNLGSMIGNPPKNEWSHPYFANKYSLQFQPDDTFEGSYGYKGLGRFDIQNDWATIRLASDGLGGWWILDAMNVAYIVAASSGQ
jgi:hypothetical protein